MNCAKIILNGESIPIKRIQILIDYTTRPIAKKVIVDRFVRNNEKEIYLIAGSGDVVSSLEVYPIDSIEEEKETKDLLIFVKDQEQKR